MLPFAVLVVLPDPVVVRLGSVTSLASPHEESPVQGSGGELAE